MSYIDGLDYLTGIELEFVGWCEAVDAGRIWQTEAIRKECSRVNRFYGSYYEWKWPHDLYWDWAEEHHPEICPWVDD